MYMRMCVSDAIRPQLNRAARKKGEQMLRTQTHTKARAPRALTEASLEDAIREKLRCVCVCVYVCVCVCVCVCFRAINTRTHTHSLTHSLSLSLTHTHRRSQQHHVQHQHVFGGHAAHRDGGGKDAQAKAFKKGSAGLHQLGEHKHLDSYLRNTLDNEATHQQHHMYQASVRHSLLHGVEKMVARL